MKKLIGALTATTLLFAVSCTGTSTTGSTTGGTNASAGPLASASHTDRASSSPSASGSAATTTGAGTSSGGIARGCELISSMDAEKVVGHIDVGPKTRSGTVPGTSSQGDLCLFEGADGKMTVGVLANTAAAAFSAFAKSLPGVQQVQGIGDQAYVATGSPSGSSAAGASVLVLKGGTYLSLSATSSTRSANDLATALQDLAKTVVDDL